MCDIVVVSSNWRIGRIGHLIGQLADLGIEEQTAIIFVSDHGFLLGEHRLGKMVRRAPGGAI